MKGSVMSELSKVVDLILTFLAFSSAIYLYELKKALPEHLWPNYILVYFLFALFWLIMSSSQTLYQSRRFMSVQREWTKLLKVNLLTLGASLVTINLVDPGIIRNRFIFYFEAFVFLFTLLVHMLTRTFLQLWRSKGRNQRYILILGTGKAAELYLQKVKDNPQLGYRVVGYLAPQRNGLRIPYLGNYNSIEAVISNIVVDLVVVTAPIAEESTQEALELLEVMGKNTAILMDEMISRVATSQPIDFGGLPMVSYSNHPRRPWHEIGKRGLDLLATGIALVLLSPVLALIALTVKLTSEGPAVFSQERVGLNGRTFKMYKFRSMVVNAEELKKKLASLNEMSGPVFKIKNDPRVTTIGKFLRKTSLDELPQLWNVFKGEMSLVGPRPPLPSEVNLYNPQHRKRLAVKPGITCIWQISGRNDVDFDQWMEMDAEYVDRWSLWLDMEILMKTVPVVLGRKGAS